MIKLPRTGSSVGSSLARFFFGGGSNTGVSDRDAEGVPFSSGNHNFFQQFLGKSLFEH